MTLCITCEQRLLTPPISYRKGLIGMDFWADKNIHGEGVSCCRTPCEKQHKNTPPKGGKIILYSTTQL
jgi:hypothetical protein